MHRLPGARPINSHANSTTVKQSMLKRSTRLAGRLHSSLSQASMTSTLTQQFLQHPVEPTVAPSSHSRATWEGQKSQHDYMLKDQCLLVDQHDNIIGQASKKDTHIFSAAQPQGLLHRAFSVFLFNSEGKLLLQQRAASKITFPSVWTNTCCSHQLSGFDPSEVDLPDAVSNGSVMGSKHAAVRKLGHELGISAHQIPLKGFRYLTRLHYCAPDPHSRGQDPQWGEHEMDYILFSRADVDVHPNAEEVSDIKWVTLPELKKLMSPSSGLTWSPWFCILVENHLDGWWADLKKTLDQEKPDEWDKIYDVT